MPYPHPADPRVCFAVVGSLGDRRKRRRWRANTPVSRRQRAGGPVGARLAPSPAASVCERQRRSHGGRHGAPWLVHDAMIHLTAPHGLEQYSVAAWGTRDVCQGPLEFLLRFNTTGRPRQSCAWSSPSSTKPGRLAAMVHAGALFRDPGQGGARRHHRLAAEGALRLHRSDRRLRLSRRTNRLAARRRLPDDRARRSGRRACREAGGDRARALHPRHASRPLRQRRLEQFAPARRSGAGATG